jgi:Ca-activated chloride channel family protein
MHHRQLNLILLTLGLGLGLGGCSNYNTFGASDMGVTQGGAQDIQLAREIIEAGGVPTDGFFTAEGLFSEHDLPLDGEPCEQVLCPRAATAMIDPVDGSGPQLLVQLGFGTDITQDDFQRRPLNLAVVVDVSGSMDGGKLDAVKEALNTMADQLDDGDQVALVAFDDRAWIELEQVTMDERGLRELRQAIDHLRPMGSTNIEAGLQLGYGEVAPHAAMPGVEDRVMLFTDAQPNTGNTGLGTFLGMARYYSEAGIGLSVFGVGLDLGTELATEVSETRGGNYFYLADEDAIAKVFDEEFDFMVSPVAYDLEVLVTPRTGWLVGDAYGAPLDEQAQVVDFGASTLFLSKRHGGMGVTLVADGQILSMGEEEEPTEEAPHDLARFRLSYETADDFTPMQEELEVTWAGGSTIMDQAVAADDMGVYKMGYLVDEFLSLELGAAWCEGRATLPQTMEAIEEAALRLHEIAAHLDSGPLEDEAILMEKLARNVLDGESSCWYDRYAY